MSDLDHNHLVVDYHLDTEERSGNPSGNVRIIVKKDNGHIQGVQLVKCTLEAIRETMKMFYEEFGDIHLEANTTGLYDYEYMHAELENELGVLQAKAFAEAEHYKKERNLATAKTMLTILESQTFAEWYEGEFMDYVEGEQGAKSQEQIVQALAHFINFS